MTRQTPTPRTTVFRRNDTVNSRRARTGAVAATGILSMLAVGGLIATPATAEPIVQEPATGVLLAPFYTELDLTGDAQVTDDDLQVVANALGLTSESAGWADVAAADVDGSGDITLTDLAAVSGRIVYDDGSFELIEASSIDMQAAMNAGVTTSVKLTQAYLDRISAYDRELVAGGTRPLNSIISTSSVALEAAAAADATRASEGMTSMLLGVPIAVKDNYNTLDMPTTAGCACWNDNQTTTDAFMVEGLRDAGAIILAKASLDEFALGFTSQFSSYTNPVTGLLVASPYNTAQTAGGSSGGTGAAIAANLAGIGFGSDTGGSIRVPSSYNQLVGIRPTVGLSSRDGIVPLALSQDTGGPIARSVTDAAVALDAVTGVDANDPITSEQTGLVPDSFTEFLDPTALAGTRIGYLTSMIPPTTNAANTAANRLFFEAVADLTAQGATVVPLTTTALASTLAEGSGSTTEFKHDLAIYSTNHLAANVQARTLTQIINSGGMVPGRASTYTGRDAVTETQYQNWAGPTGTHTAAIANGSTVATSLLDSNELDALIYPSGVPYGTYSFNMRLSPNTGMPAISVPMGTTVAGESVQNAGVNLEFLGRNYDEGTIIGLGYAFEQATKARTTPALYPALVAAP
jgi:amidase